MTDRRGVWVALVVVVAITAMLAFAASRAVGQILAFQGGGENTLIDTSTWRTYSSTAFGFSFVYPPNWQISGGKSSTAIVLGNPLSGTSTYVMKIGVAQDPQSLSSAEYVHQLLSGEKGESAPQFQRSYLTTVGGDQAYGLYGVFEFDHNAEQIYVAHGSTALEFDFPVGDANPDIASAANNNAIAHMIVDTLVW